jgi:Isochorismatase family
MTGKTPYFNCMFLYVDHGIEDSCNKGILQYLKTIASTTSCPLHSMSSQWIDKNALSILLRDLRRSLSEPNRTTLLICGSQLEDQVTLCALEALLEGFDVHLLCDLIAARNEKLTPILLMRLVQAGAVPSSLRQFLYMWLAAEAEPSMIKSLRKLLEEYEATFEGRPA